MYFRVGSVPLDPNTASVRRSGNARLNAAGYPVAMRWAFDVTVYFGSTVSNPVGRQADFARQENRLRALLAVPNQEYALHCDDGTPTDLVLSPLGALSAPKVTAVGNLVDAGPEYAGLRTMSFTVSAEYPVGNPLGVVLNFEESLAFQGDGGPLWEDFTTDSGASIRQITRPNSPCFAYQYGSATGFVGYPSYGGPHGAPVSFWPAHYKSFLSRYERLPPRRTGETLTDWTIVWNYTHTRIGSPFVGVPHLWK